MIEWLWGVLALALLVHLAVFAAWMLGFMRRVMKDLDEARSREAEGWRSATWHANARAERAERDVDQWRVRAGELEDRVRALTDQIRFERGRERDEDVRDGTGG